MANRSTLLDGTDYIDGETIEAEDANDTNDTIIIQNKAIVPIAELAYNILTNYTLSNGTYIASEYFNSAGGKNSTVNTGSTTALFNTDHYEIRLFANSGDTTSSDTFTDEANAFDGNVSTSASKTDEGGIYKNMSPAKYVGYVYVKASISQNRSDNKRIYLIYDEGLGAGVQQISLAGGSSTSYSYDGVYYLNKSVVKLGVYGYYFSHATAMATNVYELGYEYATTAEIIKSTSLMPLDGTEKSCCVYIKKSDPNNVGTTTVDITDGTTTLSAQTINKPVDITGFTSGNLAIILNVQTSSTTRSPSWYGWGVTLIK
jgi:hypothetical protein